ncbi:uncharacterized protein SAPINGB_P000588 [Magnusiomyces paraingens]|uniref:gluconokinase n=1 Tax=Magnusiomyces paraingens TaxID=2606893 RepID=A0A5E8B2D3_9ASCO|nr:uncharacterized protein SAPINGB_P000588 [Saprochaete ingens]VVT44950.1 unnamed protein product [Saprochaete ingens]
MSASVPLSDSDRWPWLESVATKSALAAAEAPARIAVASCSALKQSYREFLISHMIKVVPFCAMLLVFLYPESESDADLVASRMEQRSATTNHFMASDMISSQLAITQVPHNDEGLLSKPSYRCLPIRVKKNLTPEDVVVRIISLINMN